MTAPVPLVADPAMMDDVHGWRRIPRGESEPVDHRRGFEGRGREPGLAHLARKRLWRWGLYPTWAWRRYSWRRWCRWKGCGRVAYDPGRDRLEIRLGRRPNPAGRAEF